MLERGLATVAVLLVLVAGETELHDFLGLNVPFFNRDSGNGSSHFRYILDQLDKDIMNFYWLEVFFTVHEKYRKHSCNHNTDQIFKIAKSKHTWPTK